MINLSSKSIRIFTIAIIYLSIHICGYATPSITSVAVTNISCGNDGKLVVSATGTTLRYALIAPSDVIRVTQTSPIFDNLPAGNYTVAAYDADQPNTPVTYPVTIGGSYSVITIVSANSSIYLPSGQSEYCTFTGRASVSITGGRANYTYDLLNSANTVVSTQIIPATSVNFDNLAAGSYKIRITDCGSVITTGTIAVNSSPAVFKSTAFTAAAGTLGEMRASCNNLYILFTGITVNGVNLATYPGVRYRAVFDNVATSWATVSTSPTTPFPSVTATNFAISKTKQVYLEIEHPCTKAVFRSAVIPFTIGKARLDMLFGQTLFNPCTRVLDSVKLRIGAESGNMYYCTPYTATIALGGKTYAITGESSQYFPVATAFTIQSIVDGASESFLGQLLYANVNRTTFSYTIPTTANRDYQITTSATPFIPDNCNFTGGQIVFKPNFYMPASIQDMGAGGVAWTGEIESFIPNTKFTLTLTTGPAGSDFASKAPKIINITKSTPLRSTTEYPLWNDLIDGPYTVQIAIQDDKGRTCTISRSITLVRDFKTFNVTAPTKTGTCGSFSISGNASLTKGDNTVDTKTPYLLEIYKTDNTFLGRVTGVSNTAVNYSNSNLVAGNYIAKYKVGNCVIGSYPITIPQYIPLDVNYKLSGGLSCPPGNTANLTVVTVGGEGTIEYRIKVQGAADATYSAWQTSNIFPSKTKAINYTVQIKDNCGTIDRTLFVQDGAQQFITVLGPVAPGVVCNGGTVTFGAYSIGQILSYQWYKNSNDGLGDVLIPGATSIDYIVNNASQATLGTYTVKVQTGACALESSYTINTVSLPTATPSIIGLNKICTAGNSVILEAQSAMGSGTYQWSRGGVVVYTSATKYYTTSTVGSYTVIVIPSGGCASLASTPHVLSIGTPTAPLAPTGVSPVCASGTVLVSNPALSGVTYTWYRDGGQVQQSASNSFFATSSGNYTVSVSPIAGCVSAQSPAFTLTVHGLVSSSVAFTNVTCFGANDGGITVTALTGTAPYQYSKDGGVTWQPTNIFVNLAPGLYNVQMKDVNNCLTTISPITIVQPAIIALTPIPTHVTCFGGNSGTITASATGGSGTYQYQLNGGLWQASGVFSGLIAGTYTLVVRDAAHTSCTKSTTVIITQPAELLLPANISAPLACPNLTAEVEIANSISGAIYYVYNAATGGTLQGSGTSIGGSLIINVLTYPANTTLYVEVTSGTCTSTRKAIAIEVRPTLANYPDIRLQVCPNPDRTLNLSSFLDTTDYQSVNWTAVSTFSPTPSAEEGNIETSDLTTGTHVYAYSISNTCYTTPKMRKVYLLPLTDKQIGRQVDTVAICKDFAEGINLRQILGLAAGGTWSYDVNIAPFVRKASTYPFSNALILEGDKAYTDPALQAPAYKKRYKTDANAIHLDFLYTTPVYPGSCLSNEQRRLVIVLTSTIL